MYYGNKAPTPPSSTSTTHPNGQTDTCADPLGPPRHLLRPVNIGLQGFFRFLSSGNQTPPRTHHTSTPRPNGQTDGHDNLTTTPTPMSPTWKWLKSASMSRQRRRMALSASNDVAGTWKHFSAASSSALYSPITPLRCHTAPFTPEAREVPKHAGGQKPPACFLSFKAPQRQRSAWNE